MKQSIKLNGITDIVLTKLDVLDELKEINVCTGYLIDNKNYDYLPSEEFLFDKIKPIYKKVDGWKKSTAGINKFNDLPENAKKYKISRERVRQIEEKALDKLQKEILNIR